MVLKNSKVDDQNIGFVIGDIELDLHNCYHFIGFHYDVVLRQLSVSWKVGQGAWIGDELPARLMLKFNEVNFLQITKKEAAEFREDDGTLDNIGFADLEMRNDAGEELI